MAVPAPICAELIERGALTNAGRTAIVFGDREWTFEDINRQANRFARALHALGAGHGARVALLVNNGPYSVPLDFACVKAGLNRVPLNARLSLDEHVRMVTEADVRTLVFGPDLAGRAAELVERVPGLTALGLDASLDAGKDLVAEAAGHPGDLPPAVAHQPDDVILTLYTSGTTGVLKAAQHTQASYAGICRNILLNLFPIGREDAMLHSASLIHASGTFILPFWLRGARSVILPGFVPADFLDAIGHHKVTAINLVPTMLQMLLEQPGLSARDFSHLKHIIYGASPMPRAVITRAMEVFGQDRFWQYFGQTEAPLCLAVLRPEDHQGDLLGACGRPAVDVEIRLAGEDGHPAPPGEPGEILVRTASAAAGYFNAPDLTAETFDAEGWVHTRDVGVIDAQGFLHLRDRTSDMIISGGYNVYPREVEDALMTHPSVLEAAVVGAPHEKWVEAVTAFVVLRPDQGVTDEELIAHVAGQVASYKKPHAVLFTDAIPKTAVGKLNRKVLRAGLKEKA